MKQLASLAGVAGLAVIALVSARGHAADRAAAPALASSAMADITDVYAWMAGANLNLVMDVSPLDAGDQRFGPEVQYAFHLTSKPTLSAPGGHDATVIIRFASSTSAEAWVTDATGTKDYVMGDPSGPGGVASTTGKLRLFAGRRSDPAFFNRGGFTSGVAAIDNLIATQPPASDLAGCPAGMTAAQALGIRNLLAAGSDSFAQANVMALVVAVDKSLIATTSEPTVAVWGSTHAGS